MDGDKFRQAFKEQALREQFRDEQRRKDEAMFNSMHQLAFGSNSAGSVLKEVDDATLFMDNKLKIFAASLYAISLNNMHKLDDSYAISSKYAITEYFNILYYDNLLTPGSRCKYAINDTKNRVKHIKFLTQSFENIAQHKDSSPIERITYKWENLYKALI